MRLSRNRLIWLADGLATMLKAGLPVTRALDTLTSQGRGRVRTVLARVGADVKAGSTLAWALEARAAFPPLFVRLVEVGEATGRLDRVLAELARFYEMQRRLWKEFLARVTGPVLEYVVAVAVVAFALFILRALGVDLGSPAWALGLGYGGPVALIAPYFLVLRPLGGTRLVHEMALRVPAVAGVLRSLALARFSLVMQLTTEAGMFVREAVETALESTGNAAFAARGRRLSTAVSGGSTLTEALESSRLFPSDYIEIVRIAEESGALPERFGWLAGHHAEEAESRLRLATAVLARLVWLAVAAFIITFIFRFFSLYMGRFGGGMR